jgi:hypothetical protein
MRSDSSSHRHVQVNFGGRYELLDNRDLLANSASIVTKNACLSFFWYWGHYELLDNRGLFTNLASGEAINAYSRRSYRILGRGLGGLRPFARLTSSLRAPPTYYPAFS